MRRLLYNKRALPLARAEGVELNFFFLYTSLNILLFIEQAHQSLGVRVLLDKPIGACTL